MQKGIQGAQSYYILIRGPLGIGKSTIAKKLTKSLKAHYISLDQVMAENCLDRIDKKQNCIPPKNFIKTDDLILPEVLSYLNKGTMVIFDGCFYHKQQITHLEKSLKTFQGFVFNLKAPLETCIQRDSQRKKSYGKDAAQAVHKLVSKFDYGIDICTAGKSEAQVLGEILEELK